MLIPYLRGEQVPWGRNFNIFSQSASSSTLWYSLFSLARFQPHPAAPYRNVLIPYLRGKQVPWGRIFNIFWQSASSSTLWYNLLWLARFQPHPATHPGMCWSHIYGESRSVGAKFLTYSDRARPVLPYGTVYFLLRASNPTKPPSYGNVLIPYLRGEQVHWGRIFNIFWQSASSSTLWYSLFFFARFQPNPAAPYRNVLIPYLRGEQVPWGRIFNIFWQSASSSTLWYNLLWLARFQPHPATHPGMCWSHIYGESRSVGAEFLTYSDKARPVLPYGTVYFLSRNSNPTQPPPYGNVLIPYLRGEQVPWGRIFNILWQTASSSTLWYNLLWLARFQPHRATPPGMCWSDIYGESRSLGA